MGEKVAELVSPGRDLQVGIRAHLDKLFSQDIPLKNKNSDVQYNTVFRSACQYHHLLQLSNAWKLVILIFYL